MKLILLIAIVLSSFGAVAQTKVDTLKQYSPAVHLSVKRWTAKGDSATLSAKIDNNWAATGTSLPKMYTINWAKVKTFAQMKMILREFNFTIFENGTHFNKIKKYLKPCPTNF